MTINEGAITILVNREYVTIEIHDKASGYDFLKIELTPEQFTSAISRLSFTPVKSMEASGLNRLNKYLKTGNHEFEIPDYGYKSNNHIEDIHAIALKTCPDGWEPDKYYNSQNSFFRKDGKHYARTIIRTWTADK